MPPCSTGVPQLVSPADGTLVTQTPTLSWSHSLGTRCGGLAGVVAFRLYYGTDPANLDHLIRTEEERSRTLPVLAPNTRYFWRVFVDDGAGLYTGSQGAVSEVHSFYTSGPVATTPVTWGKVKSMYRD
jgi:hypothetical protein